MENPVRAARDVLGAYLDAYARKDLAAIEALLSDDATLRDWNLHVRGKPAVLAETAKNFAAAGSITITTLAVHEGEASIAAELRIRVDAVEIFVVDVLDFAADGRVRAVRSYIGRGNAV